MHWKYACAIFESLIVLAACGGVPSEVTKNTLSSPNQQQLVHSLFEVMLQMAKRSFNPSLANATDFKIAKKSNKRAVATSGFSDDASTEAFEDQIPKFARRLATLLLNNRNFNGRNHRNGESTAKGRQSQGEITDIHIKATSDEDQLPSNAREERLYRKLAYRLATIVKNGRQLTPEVMQKLRMVSQESFAPELSSELIAEMQHVPLTNLSKCDHYDQETKTCWFDRQIGGSITLTIHLTQEAQAMDITKVQWKKQRHNLHLGKDAFDKISSGLLKNNTDDHLVSGSGGLRISPIQNTDIDFNSFQASLLTWPLDRDMQAKKISEINFRINVLPIDMGHVYLGEELMLDIEDFIALPSEGANIFWSREVSFMESQPLPPNMKVKDNGKVLVITELSKEHQGILDCVIYSLDHFFYAKRRFLIKEPVLEVLETVQRTNQTLQPAGHKMSDEINISLKTH